MGKNYQKLEQFRLPEGFRSRSGRVNQWGQILS